MTITDAWVLNELRKLGDEYLREDVEGYPEDERDGRTDIEFFADEVSYFLSLYHEEGHDWEFDLKQAKKLIRETKDGKCIPISIETFRPLAGYNERDIQRARDIIETHDRLKAELKKLQKKEIYGRWYQA